MENYMITARIKRKDLGWRNEQFLVKTNSLMNALTIQKERFGKISMIEDFVITGCVGG